MTLSQIFTDSKLAYMHLHLIQDSAHRSGVNGGLQKSHRGLQFSSPAVEPVDELIDIFLHVSARNTMKGSEQQRFQIADHKVHLRQPVGCLFA